MKTIYLVRHAKSSWGDLTQPDFDRPLNERGQKNAPEMARRLLNKQIQIDAFVTSTAKRALQTASHFIKTYDRNVEQLELRDELYHAPPAIYREIISDLPNTISSVAIFGHNPGITEFVNSLTATRIDNMPTCGIFAVQMDSNRWSDFPLARKSFLFFDAPKLG